MQKIFFSQKKAAKEEQTKPKTSPRRSSSPKKPPATAAATKSTTPKKQAATPKKAAATKATTKQATPSVAALQQQQRAAVEEAVSEMAHQFKQQTSQIHTTLQNQTHHLLDDMHEAATDNVTPSDRSGPRHAAAAFCKLAPHRGHVDAAVYRRGGVCGLCADDWHRTETAGRLPLLLFLSAKPVLPHPRQRTARVFGRQQCQGGASRREGAARGCGGCSPRRAASHQKQPPRRPPNHKTTKNQKTTN